MAARTRHLYYDVKKRRAVYERRFPPDVAILLGPKFRHKYGSQISYKQAATICHEQAAEFEHLIQDTRRRLGTSSGKLERIRQTHARSLAVQASYHANLDELERWWRQRTKEVQFYNMARELGKTVPIKVVANNLSPFGILVSRWARETRKGQEATDQQLSKMNRLAAFLGHDNAAAVKPEDLVRYKDHLLNSGINPTTIRDHIKMLKALFRYAYDNSYVRPNPAIDLKYQAQTRDVDMRLPFTPEDRVLILTSARQAEPIIRWSNWLAVYLGLRMEDIAEADTRDIEQVDGIWCLRIRQDHRPELGDKTKLMSRDLPIADAVLAEGFLEYVAGLPAGPLFPKLPLYKGRRNKYASNIVSRWLRQLGFSGRKSFHSWRKTVRTQLENNGVSGDRARFIIGHAAKDVDARHYQEHSIQKLQPILNNLW